MPTDTKPGPRSWRALLVIRDAIILGIFEGELMPGYFCRQHDGRGFRVMAIELATIFRIDPDHVRAIIRRGHYE